MASRVVLRYVKGSTLLIFAVSMSDAMRPQARPPSSWPANNAFLRLRAIGRTRFSTLLESISTRPSVADAGMSAARSSRARSPAGAVERTVEREQREVADQDDPHVGRGGVRGAAAGGSLGAVITETGLDKTLEGLFSADAGAPVLITVLLAWFIAALLHFAIGSVSVGAITASGIIGPVVASTGVSPSSISERQRISTPECR